MSWGYKPRTTGGIERDIDVWYIYIHTYIHTCICYIPSGAISSMACWKIPHTSRVFPPNPPWWWSLLDLSGKSTCRDPISFWKSPRHLWLQGSSPTSTTQFSLQPWHMYGIRCCFFRAWERRDWLPSKAFPQLHWKQPWWLFSSAQGTLGILLWGRSCRSTLKVVFPKQGEDSQTDFGGAISSKQP